ncbi:MAG: hypothetical protein PVH25_03810 [Burkholderiales bacterium]|jgi:hypothetical protein
MAHPRLTNDIDPDENLNWADYVDALLHQDVRRNVLVSEPIKGRRLRDGYSEQVEVVKLVHPLAKES